MANLLGLLWLATMGSTFVGQRAVLALADQLSLISTGQRTSVTGPAIVRTIGDSIFTLVGMVIIYLFLPSPFPEAITGLSLGGYLLHNVKMALRANADRAMLEAETAMRARSTMGPRGGASIVSIEPPKSIRTSAPNVVSHAHEVASSTPPPMLTTFPREMIPIGNENDLAPVPEMAYDEDDNWAESLTDEEDEGALPPRELYDDDHIRELRRTIQEQLSSYLHYRRQGFFADPELHERWIENRPALSAFLDWCQSPANARTRAITKNDRDLLLEHYLFAQWI